MKLLGLFMLFSVSFIAVSAANNDDIVVSCFPTVQITLLKDAYEAFKGDDSDVVLGQVEYCGKSDDIASKTSACDGAAEGDDWHWTLSNPKDCNAVSTYDSGTNKITYEYKINRKLDVKSTIIRRKKCGCIVVQCEFSSEQEVSTGAGTTIESKEMLNIGRTNTANYQVTMSFTDDTYQGSPPSQTNMQEKMYLSTTVDSAFTDQLDYLVSVFDCAATDTENEIDGTAKYSIIDINGCPKIESFEDKSVKEVVRNKQGPSAQFWLKAFVWQSSESAQKIYLHCSVQVCLASQTDCVDSMVGDSCAPPITKRKRRSVENSTLPAVHRLTAGPMMISRDDQATKYVRSSSKILPCATNNGGCSELCVNAYGHGKLCACRPGRVLNDDGITCTHKNRLKLDFLVGNMSFLMITCLISVAVVNIFLIIFIMCRKPTKTVV